MEDAIQPTNYQSYPDGSRLVWGYSVADDPYRAICIRSYIKISLNQSTGLNTNEDERRQNRVANVVNNVRRDLNPKENATVFLRDFLPSLIIGFIGNITATGNALIAIQKTIEQQAGGVNIPPGDFARTQTGVENSLRFIMLYLKSNTGLVKNAQDFDDILQAAAEGTFNKPLDVHVAEQMAVKVKNAINFVESLSKYKDQIVRYILGKKEEEIVENAQNMIQNAQDIPNKPMGIWSKIVNWVKNKLRRNKTYTIKLVSGELNQFISNLGLVYHVAHLSSALVDQIVKTGIMNRYASKPNVIDPEYLDNIVEKIEDTLDYLKPDTVNAIDYASLNAKVTSLNGYINVLLNTLSDKSIEQGFKLIQLRSIFLLIINNLRDLASYCLTMDPLIAVMAI